MIGLDDNDPRDLWFGPATYAQGTIVVSLHSSTWISVVADLTRTQIVELSPSAVLDHTDYVRRQSLRKGVRNLSNEQLKDRSSTPIRNIAAFSDQTTLLTGLIAAERKLYCPRFQTNKLVLVSADCLFGSPFGLLISAIARPRVNTARGVRTSSSEPSALVCFGVPFESLV